MLTVNDIDEKIKEKVYTQDYSPKTVIDGVKIIEKDFLVGEDGDFSEVLRLNENNEIEVFPGFKLAQVNRTKIYPGIVKAWHLHYKQDEIWYLLPDDHIILGLWDIRKDSPTKDATMRIVLGGGKAHLAFIPKGVAHGSSTIINHPVTVIYFVNQQFDIKNPDEQRIAWDSLGKDFWLPKRD